jgi:hypothetical protein
MKSSEIIEFAALSALTAALLYRKYGKKNRTKQGMGNMITGKSPLSSKSADDDYEPYSKKENTEQK